MNYRALGLNLWGPVKISIPSPKDWLSEGPPGREVRLYLIRLEITAWPLKDSSTPISNNCISFLGNEVNKLDL